MNVQHILLTTDLSSEALRPCEPLAEFARQVGAHLTLLHVVADFAATPYGAPLAPPVASPDTAKHVEQARAALEEQRASLPADLDVRLEVVTGKKVAETVARWANQNEVDLLAISTHGRTGFRRFALGSVAEAVLQHSEVPVLCFPQRKE